MRKKLLFVFNPRSGKGRIKNSLFELTDLFTGVGYDVTVHPLSLIHISADSLFLHAYR